MAQLYSAEVMSSFTQAQDIKNNKKQKSCWEIRASMDYNDECGGNTSAELLIILTNIRSSFITHGKQMIEYFML